MIPPTAGFALGPKDFLKTLRPNAIGSLEEDLKNYLGAPYARLTCSGTAAFYLILETLKNLNAGEKVIIPSFACPLLALAIARAGLEVLVCDIRMDSFDFEPGQLEALCRDHPDILAITAVHLAGIPQDISASLALAQKHKIFLIEDCAQSLGAIDHGRPTGSQGDLSFFSFCRGKGLTIYEGGMIVSNKKEYAGLIDEKISALVKNNLFIEVLRVIELFGYALVYRPRLAWLAFGLPRIFWQQQGERLRAAAEYFSIDFPVHKVSAFRRALGHACFGRLEEEIAGQRKKAAYYIEKLTGVPAIKLITEPAGTKAAYPYLTLLFDQPRKKIAALGCLRGLGVSVAYALAISDYAYLKGIIKNQACPNGRSLAERQITLSTNSFLKEKDLEKVVRALKNIQAG